MAPIDPCAWWHTAPERMPPLQALRIALAAIEKQEPIPEPAAGIMAHALRAYLEGETTDLTGALGLRPRRGGCHETPLAMEKMKQVYTIIKKLYEMQTGSKTERARKVAQLLKTPPVTGCVTEEAVLGYTLKLHCENGGTLPTSTRQVIRIVNIED